jgi:osmoprotectant transport system permease protein
VQALLFVVAVAGAASLGIVVHAKNRLLSGAPVGLRSAVQLSDAALPVVLIAGAAVVLAIVPLLRRPTLYWLVPPAAGGVIAGLSWMAGRCADAFATSSPALARTSLGVGYWIVVVCALLAVADAVSRLRLRALPSLLAGMVALLPLAVLIVAGVTDQLSIMREYDGQRDAFLAALVRHIALVAGAVVPAALIGVPLGIAAHRRARVRSIVFPTLNIVQTIPSLAMFGLLLAPLSRLAEAVPALGRIGISGVGPAPAVIALVLYALLPIVRNTAAGLAGVPASVRDAARGMGMSRRQSLWQVEVPLALPLVLAGLRIAAVQAVGLASVAALIGAGGLGAIMFQGLFADALDLVLLGAIPVVLLATVVDGLLKALAAASEPRAA